MQADDRMLSTFLPLLSSQRIERATNRTLKRSKMEKVRVSFWYVYKMVAQNMLHIYEVKYKSYPRKKNGFFNVTKCLQQIKMADLHHMCAEKNEQPPDITTMEAPER